MIRITNTYTNAFIWSGYRARHSQDQADLESSGVIHEDNVALKYHGDVPSSITKSHCSSYKIPHY